ncbi:MAG TPA: tRNA (adenosine(37)-N6)-threonylcarbamoyltransferase complex dimerization subunit type 1 TsaB [Chloroflexia bacterium]|jgi:tRNA threonylcarbamoyladenosine biosynthesis protein TsaB
MILALDTSTEYASIALYLPGQGVVAEQTWRSGREQTTQLLPTVESLMSLLAVDTGGLAGVAVATGPGSYSGVRIGISTAKSLAFSLGIKLWGVPSLDVLAYSQVAVTAAQVCAVLSLGRGRYGWALYRTRGARWQRLTDYANNTIPEIAAQAAEVGTEARIATMFCGELDAAAASEVTGIMGNSASIAPAAAGLRRAGYLAELALQRSDRGEADDPATLQAIYLQPKAEA